MATVKRYTRTAIALHWLIAALIFTTLIIGCNLSGMPPGQGRTNWTSCHKLVGCVIFTLFLVRLIWRIGHRPPPAPAGTPAWQTGLAHAVHALLYVMMFALTATGLLFSNYGSKGVWFFNVSLPQIGEADPELAHSIREIHNVLPWGLGALLVIHVLAVIWHQLVKRDRTLSRMLPAPNDAASASLAAKQ